MALDNFKPIIWSDSIFMSYDEAMVFAPLTNRQYEQDLLTQGDKVKIMEIGDMEVQDYTGADMTFTDVDDAAKFIEITEQKALPKQIDDVDAVQANVSVMGEVTRKMGVAMAREIDTFIAGLVSEAGIVDGTEASPISITSANVTEYFSEVYKEMDESNCPTDGRVAVVPPWMAQKLTLAKIDKDTNNSAVLTSGYVGTYMGFDVYSSNNITRSGTTWYKPMFFLRGNSIAFIEQIAKVEAGRREASFKDYVKMLAVYGGKVIRPSSLKTIICAPGAES
jgi:hypothetical protein